MYKTINRILSICAVTSVCVAAHAASLNVGYCFGEIAEKGVSKVGKATVSGAIVLPPEMLSDYYGATISGVRVGLVTADGVSNLCGWVRNSLDGKDLDSAEAEAEEGWNFISLGKNIEITGDSLAVGFSFHQEKSVKCISLAGKNNPDGKWIAKNGKWEQASPLGVLSVELVITSESLPVKDLAIVSLDSPAMPVRQGEDVNLSIGLRNMAGETIEGFELAYDIDGNSSETLHFATSIPYGTLFHAPLTIDSSKFSPDEAHILTVKAICSNDDIERNNLVSLTIGSYSYGLERTVLVEEFTSEMCVNCPRAINTLEQCVNAGYGDRMNVIAHHVGYADDWLTRDEDRANTWFYDPDGLSGTFAPAVMLDRTVLEGNSVPVNSIGYFSEFEPILQQAIDAPAFVELSAYSELDNESNELTVNIMAEKLPVFDAASGFPRITIYVVEDGIPHRNQAGISGDTFTHSHVFRKCMTDIWGNPIERWNGNSAELCVSCPIESDWDPENLSIVAFIHNHDMNDIGKCNVLNSVSVKAGQSGIKNVAASEIIRYEYYSLTGLRLNSPTDGICIRRAIHSDGSFSIAKIKAPFRD